MCVCVYDYCLILCRGHAAHIYSTLCRCNTINIHRPRRRFRNDKNTYYYLIRTTALVQKKNTKTDSFESKCAWLFNNVRSSVYIFYILFYYYIIRLRCFRLFRSTQTQSQPHQKQNDEGKDIIRYESPPSCAAAGLMILQSSWPPFVLSANWRSAST